MGKNSHCCSATAPQLLAEV